MARRTMHQRGSSIAVVMNFCLCFAVVTEKRRSERRTGRLCRVFFRKVKVNARDDKLELKSEIKLSIDFRATVKLAFMLCV